MNKQQVKGLGNQAAGEIQKKVGDLKDDPKMEIKGKARELKGKAQETVGDAREDLRESDRELRERELRDEQLRSRR